MDEASALSPEQQLLEYESQLAEVVGLLEAAPDDEALLSLKSDLEELIAVMKPSESTGTYAESAVGESVSLETSVSAESSSLTALETFATAAISASPPLAADSEPHTKPPPRKKAKIVPEEFEVPQRLIVLDTDTEAEATRKRRALKALKSKWRERKKEAETEKKQQSWQSFQKKKKTTSSMFGTQEGDNASKVGVATSGRHLTQTGERKRYNNAS